MNNLYFAGTLNAQIFLAVMLSFCSGYVFSKECIVPGHQFINETDKHAIKTEVKKTVGDGVCSLLEPTVIIAASDIGSGVTCEIRFFSKVILKGDWTVTNIVFGGASADLVLREWSNNRLEVAVHVSADKGETKSLVVSQVYLNSHQSDCNNWKGAL